MDKDTKLALQVAKEIVVKFIEVGRISPTNFHSVFPSIYQVVLQTVSDQDVGGERGENPTEKQQDLSG